MYHRTEHELEIFEAAYQHFCDVNTRGAPLLKTLLYSPGYVFCDKPAEFSRWHTVAAPRPHDPFPCEGPGFALGDYPSRESVYRVRYVLKCRKQHLADL